MCNLPCSGHPKILNQSPIQPRILGGEIDSPRVPESRAVFVVRQGVIDGETVAGCGERVQARLVIIQKKPRGITP